ncbi:hypothetical protein [Bosea rubneri]|uniref:Transposase n=1 Tax=Bosea rubneri TaxID=3075434 RepID=A0ABU3SG62_9HYPH|nr:hypothetical protein [Bosea sp. ZW T0_25]MDU0343772.1 hypothetical protein [Bosea sp. ZW T0_25]
MGIARSAYYRKPATSIDDTALVEAMAAVSDSFEAYGYRRMHVRCGTAAFSSITRKSTRDARAWSSAASTQALLR